MVSQCHKKLVAYFRTLTLIRYYTVIGQVGFNINCSFKTIVKMIMWLIFDITQHEMLQTLNPRNDGYI